jgi:hypothetical protein
MNEDVYEYIIFSAHVTIILLSAGPLLWRYSMTKPYLKSAVVLSYY